MSLNEWVTVVPGRGERIRDVARALLALADDPAHVRTAKTGNEFLVHPLVAEKYHRPAQPAPEPERPRRTRRTKTEAE